jgi:hypothetical protein
MKDVRWSSNQGATMLASASIIPAVVTFGVAMTLAGSILWILLGSGDRRIRKQVLLVLALQGPSRFEIVMRELKYKDYRLTRQELELILAGLKRDVLVVQQADCYELTGLGRDVLLNGKRKKTKLASV